MIHDESPVDLDERDEQSCSNCAEAHAFNSPAEGAIAYLDDTDIVAPAEALPVDLGEASANAAETEAGSQAKAKATTGRDGKSYPRERPNRPKGQGQEEIPSKENHAKILAGLLVETGSLSAAAATLNKLILDDLDRSVNPKSTTTLTNRLRRNITTFMRIHRLLKDRTGEEAHP